MLFEVQNIKKIRSKAFFIFHNTFIYIWIILYMIYTDIFCISMQKIEIRLQNCYE